MLGVQEIIAGSALRSGLTDGINLSPIQICNINSDDITDRIWIRLARTINEMKDEADGYVILGGTDTLEETAYFLNLTVKTDRPVVLTGSMLPPSSLSPDGARNIRQAILAASSDKASGMGVLVVFSDMIFAARAVTKRSTYSLTAFSGGEHGVAGIVRDDEVLFYSTPLKVHTVRTVFDISGITSLPKVNVVYFTADADPALLKYAAGISDGIVIAGAGAGEFSESFAKVIRSLEIPVVITSRTGSGVVTRGSLLCDNTVAGDDLQPQKAAVLLRLALTRTCDRDELQEMFYKY